MTAAQTWGWSFLGTTVSICSVLVHPLVFSVFSKEKLFQNLPNFTCFGSGAMVALVFLHNFPALEKLSLGLGATFLGGITLNYVVGFALVHDARCSEEHPAVPKLTPLQEEEEEEDGISQQKNVLAPIPEEKPDPVAVIPEIPQWLVKSIIFGDAFCNFADGIIITSSFLGCGLRSGFITAAVVTLHEVTHEIGDFSLMLTAGISLRRATVYNLLSASVSYIGWLVVNSGKDISGTPSVVTEYLLAFGSGVVCSIVMTIMPRLIENDSLSVQRRRIGIYVGGAAITTLVLILNSHCPD